MGSDRKYHVLRVLQRWVVDPPVKVIWSLGLAHPGDARLETTGRRTGQPHRTPICNGLEGNTFWLIAQHGRRTDYVRNIEANPRVRVRLTHRGRWRTGTAHILDDDDARERRKALVRDNPWRQLCQHARSAMSTDPLTIRIDLDPDV